VPREILEADEGPSLKLVDDLALVTGLPGWESYIDRALKKLNQCRKELLFKKDLTPDDRLYYAGQLEGAFQVLRLPYDLIGEPVPQKLRAYFKGEL